MAKKAQHEWQPDVPDYQTAEIRKKLLDIVKAEPTRAKRMGDMLEMCRLGVSPDTAARAALLFDNWDEDEDFRKAVEAAYAQFAARVEMKIGADLAAKPASICRRAKIWWAPSNSRKW